MPNQALRIGTGPDDLARLYPWLETAGMPDALLPAMHVALEEAVVNVAMHGGATAISVTPRIVDDAALLIVEDDGQAFDPIAAPLPDPADRIRAPEPGGLGLTLLRHFCREILYERVDGQNRLTMRFPLPGP